MGHRTGTMLPQSPGSAAGRGESGGGVLGAGSSGEAGRSEVSARYSGTACSSPILVSDTDSEAEEEVVRKRKVPHRSTSGTAQEGKHVTLLSIPIRNYPTTHKL